MKKTVFIIFIIIAVAVAGSIYFTGRNEASEGEDQEKTYTLGESREIAFNWMREQCPTYTYDGEDLNLKGSRQIQASDCNDCYEFVFSFKSRHGGFGDREGDAVTQAITPHLTTVTVANGEVAQALTDNGFDELAGETREVGQGVNKLQPQEVELFYYNENEDIDEQGQVLCSPEAVQSVKRIIPGEEPIRETIELLLKGNTRSEEREDGFQTEFPHEDFELTDMNLDTSNGNLTLTFSEVPGFTTGGSCRVTLLRAQIEKTAEQFPEVKEVVIKPETLFQP